MAIGLQRLTTDQLARIVDGTLPSDFRSRVEPGALPPAFVARRALEWVAEGVSEEWANTFLMVRDADERIIGGCGFKGAPNDGCVEIGYAVSPVARGQGVATLAVKVLVAMAHRAGVGSVLAEISPDNTASERVVQKAGFVMTGSRVDEDGEFVQLWLKS